METSPKPSASDGKVLILPLACPFHPPPPHISPSPPPEDSGHYPRPGEEGRGERPQWGGTSNMYRQQGGRGMQINKPKSYISILKVVDFCSPQISGVTELEVRSLSGLFLLANSVNCSERERKRGGGGGGNLCLNVLVLLHKVIVPKMGIFWLTSHDIFFFSFSKTTKKGLLYFFEARRFGLGVVPYYGFPIRCAIFNRLTVTVYCEIGSR